jgi:succinyl-CoA synthetase beta subunit
MPTQLDFKKCRTILDKHGIHTVPSFIIESSKDLAEFSKKAGFPAVMKVFSPSIVHKTKEGFVKTNIWDFAELSSTYQKMVAQLKKRKITNYFVLVQKETRGNEFIIGAKYDMIFGHVVIFGLGGINAESLKTFNLGITPITAKLAKDMISKVPSPILRDDKVARKIAELLKEVSSLAMKEKIMEMDLNPVIVNERGVHVVDVRMVR